MKNRCCWFSVWLSRTEPGAGRAALVLACDFKRGIQQSSSPGSCDGPCDSVTLDTGIAQSVICRGIFVVVKLFTFNRRNRSIVHAQYRQGISMFLFPNFCFNSTTFKM